MHTELNLTEINAVVLELLKERMDRFGFDHAEVHEGSDHAGTRALFIDAFYRLSTEPVDSYQVYRVQTDLRDELIHRGEERFPYVRHHFDEKQQVAKWKPVKQK